MTKSKLHNEHWWLIFITAIAIFRLVLTSDRDILALNSPHDELWFIHTALNRIWAGSYNVMSFIKLPIYSAWLYLLHLLGIPARLAIDVSWLLAISYLAFAIHRLTRKAWLAALLLLFLALHPYTIALFDRALPETLLTVISAAVLGAGIEIWNCRDDDSVFRRRIAIVIFVAGFAVAFHIRPEGIVLVTPLLLLACCSWFDRHNWWHSPGLYRLAIPLSLAPLLSILTLGTIIAGGNYLKSGVFARYELAAPGYKHAVAALNSIDVGQTPRQIAVTRETRSLAYKESPTFFELQAFMEGPPGQGWTSISSKMTHVPGEIANGWFCWALRDAAARAGWHKDAKSAESKYAAVANEIEKAFSSGRLNKRKFTSFSFLDPDLGKWIPELPRSALNVLLVLVRPQPGYLSLSSENASASQFDQYVAITGRRTMPDRFEVAGWAILPKGTSIGIGTENSVYSWEPLSGPQRPDVPGAYGFSLLSISNVIPPTELHFLTPDNQKGTIALSELKEGRVSTFSGDIKAYIGVDHLESNSKSRRADRFLSQLCFIYEWIGYTFCLTAIGGILLLLIRRKHVTVEGVIIVLAISAITARVAIFSIIDASSYNATQARYLLPIIPAFGCLGVLGLSLLIRGAIHKQRVYNDPGTGEPA